MEVEDEEQLGATVQTKLENSQGYVEEEGLDGLLSMIARSLFNYEKKKQYLLMSRNA